ncbi:uncharacterized protein LOC125312610 isoform X2 [Rhodamnia argentea]|uniref:Uncharacterized protein LOC125312610 isoform X2 n=1 Tax=Rhodamnia argentea TaxID=178133 RepID=A0ABM3GS18_9MYRT|nr:uncharacterized protein LOC125312610 isoform X2 [Rhodamnia argentea]
MASQKDESSAKWTDSLTNLFISLMVEETGLEYKQARMKNKMNRLRRDFGSFKKLLSQSGFGWDYVNKVVVVDDPSIWEKHIKENNEWAKFKKDGFPQYSELSIIFGDTYALGEEARGNVEDLMVSEEGDNRGNHADDDPNEFGEHPIDHGVFTSGQHNLDMTPNSKRRRKSIASDVANTCKVLQEMMKSRASQQSDSAATSQVTSSPVDPFFVSAVIEVLLSMPEVDSDLYHKALERAMDSATWREAFIQTPTEMRNGLLQRL